MPRDQVVPSDVGEPVQCPQPLADPPRPRGGRPRALAALGLVCLAAALALVSCGDDDSGDTGPTRTVDTAQVESDIDKQLSTATAEVSSVKCPEDVEVDAGASFTCSVAWSNGATGKVEATQESAGQGTYEPVPGSVQVPGSTVEQSIQQELAKQGAPNAQVNCPDTIIVKVDTTVTCDLSSASGQATGSVTFTFSDATGTVDPSSVQAG